jgi:hypothetical protein
LTKLGTYLVLKRIWNHIDFQGHRSKSPGQIFRRGDTPRFALPLFKLFLNDLPEILKNASGSVNANNNRVDCLMYADDIVINRVDCLMYADDIVIFRVDCLMYADDIVIFRIDCLMYADDIVIFRVDCLMYADNIVIFSETQEGLQERIDLLHTYCSNWCLSVNLSKTNVVIFNKTGKYLKHPVYFNGTLVRSASSKFI